MSKKIGLILGLSLVLVFAVVVNVQATTTATTTATSTITSLIEQIRLLQARLAEVRALRSQIQLKTEDLKLKLKLFQGDSGPEVRILQQVLRTDKSLYPEGLVTGNFGPMTRAAVTRLQAKHGLPVTGQIDDATQALLNEIISTLGTTTPAIPADLLERAEVRRLRLETRFENGKVKYNFRRGQEISTATTTATTTDED